MSPAWLPALVATLALAGAIVAWGPGTRLRRGVGARGRRWGPGFAAGRRAPGAPAAGGRRSAPPTGGPRAGADKADAVRDVVPLVCDAVAALLESGLGLEDALEAAGADSGPAPALGAVGRSLRWGAGWDEAWAAAPGLQALAAPLALSALTGAPAVALLRDAAREERKRRARAEEAEAAAITVRLVLPLGLCALPAFICLGIVPVALALLPWA